MIKYFFYQKNPASHYIYVDMHINEVKADFLQLQLPTWRPGRYELGNFAKNIKCVEAFNEKNEPLYYTKLTKDLWKINVEKASSIKVTYSYYASELNAGACFADSNQLYVNPIHCCMYVVDRTNEIHQIELQIPDTYKIATSLIQNNKCLTAANYDELVDSPFMASNNIKTFFYEVNDIKFYMHFNGECQPNIEQFRKDFYAFTKKQIDFWGDFPYNEYHFLFQVLSFKFYHGVEHKKSTVIAIGPGYSINEGLTYEDVLGVSCHELFHTWNIKTIRPKEMMPYNYTKENYASTGYVYEGFTTYYGDKLLFSSDVFTFQQYIETLQDRLLKHFHNFGRYNLSVAASSWETWLDGYLPGAPYRKTNIYDEGSLIAFILDVSILKATKNKKSLRDVCLLLYHRFGKNQIGYTEKDIFNLVNEVSGIDLSQFLKKYAYSPSDFEEPLLEAFKYLGFDLIKQLNPIFSEQYFGFKTIENGLYSKISIVAPYSPAWKAGLFNGDEILSVNGIALKNNLNNWLQYFINFESISLVVNSNEQTKIIQLQKDKKDNTFFGLLVLRKNNSFGLQAHKNFEVWKNC